MTDRISHGEALACVNGQMSEQQVLKLLAYINQQVESEADTVSRAEHEAAFGALRALAAWCRANYLFDKGLPEELHEAEELFRGSSYGTNGDMYRSVNRRRAEAAEAQLTALQAELDLARAACDAESARVLALQARVAELVGAANSLIGAMSNEEDQGKGSQTERAFLRLQAMVDEHFDGEASPPPAVEPARRPECPHGVGLCTSSCPSKAPPIASIEAGRVQTSPFQQVAEASVQPAPGGVERCTCSYSGDVSGKHAGHARSCLMHADPVPADQPRPDYVTYDVLIEVLRSFFFHKMADRLSSFAQARTSRRTHQQQPAAPPSSTWRRRKWMTERCHHCDRPMWDGEKGSESLLTHCFLPGDSTCEVYCLWTEDRARITKLEEDLAGEAATSQARLEALQRIARAVGAEGSLMVAEQVECRIAKLEAVATEAAAMLTETNHGGLSHARSASMQNALVAAGVPIPRQCSACPHEEPRSLPREPPQEET